MNSILTLKIYFVLLSVIRLWHVDSKFLLKPIYKKKKTWSPPFCLYNQKRHNKGKSIVSLWGFMRQPNFLFQSLIPKPVDRQTSQAPAEHSVGKEDSGTRKWQGHFSNNFDKPSEANCGQAQQWKFPLSFICEKPSHLFRGVTRILSGSYGDGMRRTSLIHISALSGRREIE